jgi:hypothetical protein
LHHHSTGLHVVCVGVGCWVGGAVCVGVGAVVRGGAAVVGRCVVAGGVVGGFVVGLVADAEGDTEPDPEGVTGALWPPGVVGKRPASSGAAGPELLPGTGSVAPVPGPPAPPPEPPVSAAIENIASAPTTATAPTP